MGAENLIKKLQEAIIKCEDAEVVRRIARPRKEVPRVFRRAENSPSSELLTGLQEIDQNVGGHRNQSLRLGKAVP